jgi:hypothetical protein
MPRSDSHRACAVQISSSWHLITDDLPAASSLDQTKITPPASPNQQAQDDEITDLPASTNQAHEEMPSRQDGLFADDDGHLEDPNLRMYLLEHLMKFLPEGISQQNFTTHYLVDHNNPSKLSISRLQTAVSVLQNFLSPEQVQQAHAAAKLSTEAEDRQKRAAWTQRVAESRERLDRGVRKVMNTPHVIILDLDESKFGIPMHRRVEIQDHLTALNFNLTGLRISSRQAAERCLGKDEHTQKDHNSKAPSIYGWCAKDLAAAVELASGWKKITELEVRVCTAQNADGVCH